MKIEKTDNNKFDIIVPHGVQYIKRDWLDFDIPQGQCIVNKKLTGCGITEWALLCNKDIILCSPRIMLLDNKFDQHRSDVCYIMYGEEEDTTNSDKDLEQKKNQEEEEKEEKDDSSYLKIFKQVRNYIEETDGIKPIKLLVTYDSFPVLKLALLNLGYLDRFHVIVDEFQSLLVDSRFKSETEMSFLWSLKSIKNLCYVSATPMLEDYISEIPELKDLPYYNLNWEKDHPGRTKKPHLKIRSSESVYKTCKSIIESYLSGNFEKKYITDKDGNLKLVESKEAVIFVNSVNNILSIIKKAGLKPEQVNILCAKNNGNSKKIKNKLGKNYSIGKIPLKGQAHKMFTFCTRTVYLGADFNSSCARTFIISDANIDNLAVDISLDLPQILGRQRNEENPWRDEAILYFKLLNTTKQMSQDDFNEIMKVKQKESEDIIRAFELGIEAGDFSAANSIINLVKKSIILDNYKTDYVSIDYSDASNPKPVINRLVKLAERRAFEIQQVDFADRFTLFSKIDVEIGLDKINSKVKEFFEDYDTLKTLYNKLKMLCDVYDRDEKLFNLVIDHIADKNFKLYFKVLGKDRIVSLGYNSTKLNKELDELINFNEETFIERLKKCFIVGEKYTNSYIKENLEQIFYNSGGNPNKKFNPSELGNWFKLKNTKITVNGKREYGYIIEEAISGLSNA